MKHCPSCTCATTAVLPLVNAGALAAAPQETLVVNNIAGAAEPMTFRAAPSANVCAPSGITTTFTTETI